MDKCPGKDGGPIASGMEVFSQGASQRLYPVGGLTIRDWFAGMALTSMCKAAIQDAAASRKDPIKVTDELARACYVVADHMLDARKLCESEETNPTQQ